MVIVDACNPSTWLAEAGGSGVGSSLCYMKPSSKKEILYFFLFSFSFMYMCVCVHIVMLTITLSILGNLALCFYSLQNGFY